MVRLVIWDAIGKIACVSAQLMLFCSFVKPTQNKVYLILSYLILSCPSWRHHNVQIFSCFKSCNKWFTDNLARPEHRAISNFCLSTLELRPEYSGRSRSLLLLLMSWRSKWPGYQQQWYWFSDTVKAPCSIRKDFYYLHYIYIYICAQKCRGMLNRHPSIQRFIPSLKLHFLLMTYTCSNVFDLSNIIFYKSILDNAQSGQTLPNKKVIWGLTKYAEECLRVSIYIHCTITMCTIIILTKRGQHLINSWYFEGVRCETSTWNLEIVYSKMCVWIELNWIRNSRFIALWLTPQAAVAHVPSSLTHCTPEYADAIFKRSNFQTQLTNDWIP